MTTAARIIFKMPMMRSGRRPDFSMRGTEMPVMRTLMAPVATVAYCTRSVGIPASSKTAVE